jgi:chaperonin cofactor prefoldin
MLGSELKIRDSLSGRDFKCNDNGAEIYTTIQISDIERGLTSKLEEINELRQLVEVISNDIVDLTNNVATSLNSLQTQINTTNSNVTSVQNQANSLQTQINTTNSNVTSVQNQANSLQTQINTANTNISLLQTTALSLQNQINFINSNLGWTQPDINWSTITFTTPGVVMTSGSAPSIITINYRVKNGIMTFLFDAIMSPSGLTNPTIGYINFNAYSSPVQSFLTLVSNVFAKCGWDSSNSGVVYIPGMNILDVGVNVRFYSLSGNLYFEMNKSQNTNGYANVQVGNKSFIFALRTP